MQAEIRFSVGGYELAAGRFYDRDSHLWVAATAAGGARLGFDPLGSESAGDIVALSFEPPGSKLARGESFGTVEAAKFVGPLVSPISGTLVAHNEAVITSPGRVNQEPIDSWLVEIEPSRFDQEVALLLSGRERLAAWFADEIERYRRKGMIAE